ncbi:MAG: NUDIX domain-containing protein [Ilumatobacteraceae bacterium]
MLSDNWYHLHRAEFDQRDRTGRVTRQRREVYDRGNGATVLLLDPVRDVVLLTRQFRVPIYLNGHHDGMLIETAGGLLDDGEVPETTIRREAEEETGFRPIEVHEALRLYMSPGAVTEWLALFVATYDSTSPVGSGGGLDDEGEDIELVELPRSEAFAMASDGRIQDAKTVLLLQWLQLHPDQFRT